MASGAGGQPPGGENGRGEEPLVFYYNRERRIAGAPQIVQDYYAGKNQMPKGIIKPLVSSPGKRILFFSIIALCVMAIFLTNTVNDPSRGSVGGIPAELSAFAFEDTVFVSLRLGPKPDIREAPLVTAAISVFNADSQLFETKVLEKDFQGEETFLRTRFGDYDILRVEAELSVLGQSAALKTSVTRK